MGARAFVWLGGALFATSLGVCAWSYTFVMGRMASPSGWLPLAADAVLITIFATHHSLFARDRIKTWMTRLVPASLLRSVFVWIASLLLILTCASWQPIGGTFYAATGAAAFAFAAVQLAGLLITAGSVARIDPLELAGIRPATHAEGLQVTGPYRLVRHPLYFGWVLMVFGASHMTGDRLAFAALTTAYLAIAIPWEERSLRASFGDAYANYQRDVKWRMLPFIY